MIEADTMTLSLVPILFDLATAVDEVRRHLFAGPGDLQRPSVMI